MTTVSQINKEEVLKILSEVFDPEVPVLNVVGLGIVRDVEIENKKIVVSVTPTYLGCPAMKVIEDEILSVLKKNGFENVEIKTVYSPSWTTDWLTEDAKKKLKDYGIAPPKKVQENIDVLLMEGEKVICPYCNSENTILKSAFGSTACKAIHYCNNCHQPFEEFKCH